MRSRTGAVVIANVGTALTIDAVSASGRHRGGAIVPGPATMVASLLSRHTRHPPPRAAAAVPDRARCSPPTPRAPWPRARCSPPRHSSIARCVEAQRELKGRPRAVPHRRRGARLAALFEESRPASCPTSCCAAWRSSRRSEDRSARRICYTRASRACRLTPSFASQPRVLRVVAVACARGGAAARVAQGGRAAAATGERGPAGGVRQWQLRHRRSLCHQRACRARTSDLE